MINIPEKLVKAIENREIIKLRYKDQPMPLRTVEPYIIYESSTTKILIDVYQLNGYSSHPEKIPNWERFNLDHISDIYTTGEKFDPRSEYNPSSERYNRRIFYEI